MAINKVIYAGKTLMDLTSDTVDPEHILSGYTAHDKSGAQITGAMPNNACHNDSISTVDEEVIIPRGYHDGSGTIFISATEQQKIIPSNIKNGVTILGVKGTCETSSEVTAHSKTVTPTTSDQTVLPDAEFDYLSEVTVKSIPYTETSNSAGGTTVSIAG